MECPKCGLMTDQGAAFCGNCGQRLHASPMMAPAYGQALAPLAVAATQGRPAYAFTGPTQHRGEMKATVSLVFGVIAIAGALFMALVGILLGVVGLVFGTLSRHSVRRGVSTAGIVVSSIAIVVSLGAWSYIVTKNNQAVHAAAAASKTPNSSSAVAANSVTTPCYTAGFKDELNVAVTNNSCNMEAFNGTTLDDSTEAYKVYGSSQPSITTTNFMSNAKSAIEKDVHTNLPSFNIDNESVGQFAGSPAYIVNASNQSSGVAYVEAATLHAGSGPDNVFVFVHAVTGTTTDLQNLEAGWQWK